MGGCSTYNTLVGGRSHWWLVGEYWFHTPMQVGKLVFAFTSLAYKVTIICWWVSIGSMHWHQASSSASGKLVFAFSVLAYNHMLMLIAWKSYSASVGGWVFVSCIGTKPAPVHCAGGKLLLLTKLQSYALVYVLELVGEYWFHPLVPSTSAGGKLVFAFSFLKALQYNHVCWCLSRGNHTLLDVYFARSVGWWVSIGSMHCWPPPVQVES